MKKQQSRRDFTKSVTAALASVPLLSSIGKAQEEIANEPDRILLSFPWEPTHVHFRSDHIPPTVFGDWGSFFVESKHKIAHRRTEGSGARREIYTADEEAGKEYGDIARVQVLTEFEKVFSYYLYTFPENFNAQLRIWFSDDPEADPEPTGESQLLVMGNYRLTGSSPRTLLLEMNQKKLEETPKPIKKKGRMHKHEHKDNNNRFRMSKWQLTRSNGNMVFEDIAKRSGATGYKIMVSFYDPSRTMRDKR